MGMVYDATAKLKFNEDPVLKVRDIELTVRSDAQGVASGTFRSASDATAVWGGVQIVGPGYAEYVPEATVLFCR